MVCAAVSAREQLETQQSGGVKKSQEETERVRERDAESYRESDRESAVMRQQSQSCFLSSPLKGINLPLSLPLWGISLSLFHPVGYHVA